MKNLNLEQRYECKKMWKRRPHPTSPLDAGSFGVQRIFYPHFPENTVMRQAVFLNFLAVGTFYFPLSRCHRLESRKFGSHLVR